MYRTYYRIFWQVRDCSLSFYDACNFYRRAPMQVQPSTPPSLHILNTDLVEPAPTLVPWKNSNLFLGFF
jgi:hypothetical protein